MSPNLKPKAPLPPPICSDVPGTWAYDTMSRRIRETILTRVFRENDFLTPEMIANLRSLDHELANAGTTKLRYLHPDSNAPDVDEWNERLKPYANDTWLSAPWLVAEFYFYRRVIEAIQYFRYHDDPFKMQKELGVSSAVESMSVIAEKLNTVTLVGASASSKLSNLLDEQLLSFIMISLWGNRMDLSIWPVGDASRADAFTQVLDSGFAQLLANDSIQLLEYVSSFSACNSARIDIVVDNAGFELFCDLCLADYLISLNRCAQVVIQLKGHPTFVSDAMTHDLMFMVDYMVSLSSHPALVTLGKRWKDHIRYSKWILKQDLFWAQPWPFWEMPQRIYDELNQQSNLVFVKGDANYRRLLGDRPWELSIPAEQVFGYFPAPICALRTLKAELGCGMNPRLVEAARSKDPEWMVNGKWGVFEFIDTTK